MELNSTIFQGEQAINQAFGRSSQNKENNLLYEFFFGHNY